MYSATAGCPLADVLTIDARPNSRIRAARKVPMTALPRNQTLKGVDRYVAAFENADVETLVAVLTEDAVFEMSTNPGKIDARPEGSQLAGWFSRAGYLRA